MSSPTLAPIFVGLRMGLWVLFGGLTLFVVARALLVSPTVSAVLIAVALAMLATYALGSISARRRQPSVRAASVWLGVLLAEWIVLLLMTPDAAYIAFPLFFVALHVWGSWWGSVAVVGIAAIAVGGLGLYGGWRAGSIIGPIVGAGVALLIGLGYQALAREQRRRTALLDELLATRGQLAATEHASGVLAERARLAREIHDTLAQGLSSIQMLLYAAERADPQQSGTQYIRLARETAATNLAEARRFVRELTPPDLDDHRLGGALRRLADTQWRAQGLPVEVRVSDAVDLPMHVQTALLRIAQGAVANIIQHADATQATISLTVSREEIQFSVADDGRGFDAESAFATPHVRSDSFGLHATRERVDQLGGTLRVQSSPGHGTVLTVELSTEVRA